MRWISTSRVCEATLLCPVRRQTEQPGGQPGEQDGSPPGRNLQQKRFGSTRRFPQVGEGSFVSSALLSAKTFSDTPNGEQLFSLGPVARFSLSSVSEAECAPTAKLLSKSRRTLTVERLKPFSGRHRNVLAFPDPLKRERNA